MTTLDTSAAELMNVSDLLNILDPQYRIEGLNDDGEIDPNWSNINNLAAQMSAGTFRYDDSPLTIVVNHDRTEQMVFDGNHRVLAADLAGIAALPVLYTSRPLG